ncbi:NUDIX domain-containing protein [Streptomyces gamaensis]|uniref:NUDIX domain-containing protein n=1 Tax=Streptomyces gamaensis TaxID=1763542 RepID=A0ABW0ZBJ6_9ACTN
MHQDPTPHADFTGGRPPFEHQGRQERPDRYRCVVDLIVLLHRDDGRVLLLRRAGDVYASGLLAPVGGHLERGESVVEGALRETREEVGVVVDPGDLEFCHLVHHRGPQGQARLGVVFTAQRWTGEPRNLEPEKCSGLLWVDPACPPVDCVPYTAAVLGRFVAGSLLSVHGWPVAEGAV